MSTKVPATRTLTRPRAATDARGSAGPSSFQAAAKGAQGTIGFRLRALRRQREVTLDALASDTGLNKSYLSRLERGEKGPSIATVVKLAHALDTTVSYLFGETTEGGSIHVRRAPLRSDVISEEAPSYAVLSRDRASGQAEVFLMTPPPAFGEQGHHTHGGEECFYVLRGQVEVEFSDRVIELGVGDFMQFAGHMPHRVRRRSKDASVLVVIAGR